MSFCILTTIPHFKRAWLSTDHHQNALFYFRNQITVLSTVNLACAKLGIAGRNAWNSSQCPCTFSLATLVEMELVFYGYLTYSRCSNFFSMNFNCAQCIMLPLLVTTEGFWDVIPNKMMKGFHVVLTHLRAYFRLLQL